MKEIISKQELVELNKVRGRGKGIVLKPALNFVLRKKGKDGLLKLEKVLADLDCPMIKYGEIRPMGYYRLSWKAIMLVAIKRVFGFSEEEFEVMGREAADFPSLTKRILMKYFFSPDRIAKEAPRVWRDYFTVGNLDVINFDLEKKEELLRLTRFEVHPLECRFLTGYFSGLLQRLMEEDVEGKETKCVFRGDDCHEFLLTW